MKTPFTPMHRRHNWPAFTTNWRCMAAILFLITSLSFTVSAQSIQWDKTLGGVYTDKFVTALPTSDGGYILGGNSNSPKSGDKSTGNKGATNTSDYWVVKLNADGSKAWDKTIGGNSSDGLSFIYQTVDGGFLLGGGSTSGKSGDKSEERLGDDLYSPDYWVVKLDANGNKMWDKTFDRAIKGIITGVLQETNDGGILLGRFTTNYKDNTYLSRDYGWVKLNVDGSNGGEKVIWTTKERIDGYLFQQSRDGGYLVGGGNSSYSMTSYHLIKLSASLTKVWEKTIKINEGDALNELQETQDGGYILGGSATTGTGEYKSEPGKGGRDYWLIKLNADGSKAWDRTIGGSGNDFLHDLWPTSDGGYFIGGGSQSNSSGDKTENNRGGADYWVVKLDLSGKKDWDLTLGGNDTDALETVFQTKDGNYFVGGYSLSGLSGNKTQASNGGNDYWVVKLNSKPRKKQSITFEPISDVNFAAQKTISLKAVASSGLPVSFSIISGPATVKGNTLTLTGGSGTVTVEALQAGNAAYLAAQDVAKRFIVHVPPVTRLWDKSFGGVLVGESSECDVRLGRSHLAATVNTPDGGYLLGGTSNAKKGNDKSQDNRGVVSEEECLEIYESTSDYWIVKTDANGNILWDKTFGGDLRDVLVTVIATPDGGYLLGGNSNSEKTGDKSEGNKGRDDFWLVKVDANGNKIWDKTLGTAEYDILAAMTNTPDGGYLLSDIYSNLIKLDANGSVVWRKKVSDKSAGQALIPTPDGGFLLAGSVVVKVDANGNKQWEKTYGVYISYLVAAPDNGYVLGASSEDYRVIKIDAIGIKQWDKTYGGNERDMLTSLITTPDGGYLLGGDSASPISGDKSEVVRGGGYGFDYWIVKIDNNGNKEWDRTFGTIGSEDHLSSLLLSPDGSYLLSGDTNAGISGDKSQPLKGIKDYWVIKIKEEIPTVASWNMRYGGSRYDNLSDVIKTVDGGYLSGGYTNSEAGGDVSQASRGGYDFWIVKSDKNGKKLWDKRFGGNADDFINRVIQTKDGGYLLAGSSRSGISGDKTQPRLGKDFWVVKVDAMGNKQWDKTLGSGELIKVVQLATGEYVLGGYTSTSVEGGQSQPARGGEDYWLVKISATGTKIWDKRYGGSLDDYLGSFTLTNDGGFVLAGTSYSRQSGDKSEPRRGTLDYWVVRTDKNGNKLWDKTFGGSEYDRAYSVGRGDGDTFFISGESWSPVSGDKSQPNHLSDYGTPSPDYWIVKIDGNGKKIWDKTFGGSGYDLLRASTVTPDGGILLAGSSTSDQSGDKSQPSRGGLDYWIVQLDKNGNKQWDQTYGGGSREELRSVVKTADGGFVLGGRSESGMSGDATQPNQGLSDFWLVKVAPQNSSIQAARVASITEEATSDMKDIQVQAYPNPFSEKATISFTLTETQSASVKVYDGQGREIATLFNGEAKANQRYEVEWKAANQAAGLYILQLQTATTKQQHKLLLTK